MKLLKVTQFGNPILRKKAKKVSVTKVRQGAYSSLIENMFFTMRKNEGVGIAAPQVGEPLQLAVIEIPNIPSRKNQALEATVIFNPKITRYSRRTKSEWEGCLSFPELRGLVPRSVSIDVEYYNENGKRIKRTYKDFRARVFQHEIDHLSGTLFTDRMKDMSSLMTLDEFNKRVLKQT